MPNCLPCAPHICLTAWLSHSLLHCLKWWWGQLAGACDCSWKTAYWSTVMPQQIELTRDELCMLAWRSQGQLWQCSFLFQDITLSSALWIFPSFVLLVPASYLQNTTDNSICAIPCVWDMIQNDSTLDPTLCGIQHPWEQDLSEHVWLIPFSTVHWLQFMSAVSLQAQVSVSWLLAGVWGTF